MPTSDALLFAAPAAEAAVVQPTHAATPDMAPTASAPTNVVVGTTSREGDPARRTSDGDSESKVPPVPLALATSAVVSTTAGASAPQSARERTRREAAAALTAQLSIVLADDVSRGELEAIPDIALRLRVRVWLLIVLRKVGGLELGGFFVFYIPYCAVARCASSGDDSRRPRPQTWHPSHLR